MVYYVMNFQAEETFLTVYKKRLKEAAKLEANFITTNVNPYEQYIERVGYLRGIEQALALFEDVQKGFFPDSR